jgi:plasmid stabilization system protein ParE
MGRVEKIIWTKDGLCSLEKIVEFIAKDSRYFAVNFAKNILTRIEKLPDFPHLGRIVPEYEDPALRELIYQNYRIVYKITETVIYVILVIHGSHRLPDKVK